MDYEKLVYYLSMNLFVLFILIVIILLIVQQYRKKSGNFENDGEVYFQKKKSYNLKPVPGALSSSEIIIGLAILAAIGFYYFTIPFLCDVPYLISRDYVELKGIVTHNSDNGITVAVTFGNGKSEDVEISGVYDLQVDEKIVLEYLPYMDMRVNWYRLDAEILSPVYSEHVKVSLIDNKFFLLLLAFGSPVVSKFVTLIVMKKCKKENEEKRKKSFRKLIYMERITQIIAIICILRFLYLRK